MGFGGLFSFFFLSFFPFLFLRNGVSGVLVGLGM